MFLSVRKSALLLPRGCHGPGPSSAFQQNELPCCPPRGRVCGEREEDLSVPEGHVPWIPSAGQWAMVPLKTLKDSPSDVNRDLSQHISEVTAGIDWGKEPGHRSQVLRINAGGNEGVQLEDKMVYGNQIKILCIEIYTVNAQDDFSRIKTMKYWSQNMKDENRDPSHPLKLMKVWFDLKTISIAKLMVRKEIKLCIVAAFQESGAEDRDMQENRKIHYKYFFSFVLS